MGLNRLAKRLIGWTILIAAAWVLVEFTTPDRLIHQPVLPELPEDLDGWLASTEAESASAYPLVPGTEKRIRWQQPGVRTDVAVLYLHGFSATRQEIAPVPEMVADALGANLFETRLTGHGRLKGAMLETTAEDWLDDAAEAIAVGERIGRRIVIIATSTGATLAVAMLGETQMRHVDGIVMISPNFGPVEKSASWLTRPGGRLLARLLAEETQVWQAHNEAQERYWSTSYPTAVLIEVMRLVDRAHSSLSHAISQNVLMLYSYQDEVVSVDAFVEAFDEMGARQKQAIEIFDAGDPKRHVLAGRILSPNKNEEIAELIVDFVKRYRL